MTPKELLEKHGGDPLTAAEDYENLAWLDVPFDEDANLHLWVGSALSHQMRDFVESVIAHLGEDGAEQWGQALAAIVVPNTLMLPVPVSAPNRLEPILSFTQITRIANATDRERLAACIVALARPQHSRG